MKYFLLSIMTVCCAAGMAQTANNDAASISWSLASGSATEQAALSPETASQFFEKAEITVGSGLAADGAGESEIDKVTQTKFKVKTKTTAASDANAVTFLLTMKQGIAFTPTKVSLKAFRWVTDKGSMDIAWVYDDAAKPLVSGTRPNRATGSGASSASVFTYDLSGTPASEQQCGVKVNIYGFDANKWLSLGDVIIEGTLYGTAGQPLTYSLTLSMSPEGAGSIKATPEGPTYTSGQQVTLVQQPADGYVFTGWQTGTGKTLSTADNYTFNIKGNMTLTASYITEESLLVNDYIVVGTQEEFRAAIKEFNETPSALRRFIFLKNGVYDYGEYKNPESGSTPYGRDTIKADNISLIGQSAEGVTITITPTMSSVSRTAPIVITGTGTYLQDMTMHNNYDYSGNDGQAAALMDKGHHTIGKNMRFVSRQDTYYSNTDNGQLYFEDSHFEGTVDFICGRGDVFFNRCDLLCVNRYPKQGSNKGDTHIAAPYTIGEDFNSAGGHGYIFMDCTVDCQSMTWDFGRGWRGWPKAAFLNTKLTEQARLRLGTDQTSGKAVDYSLRVGTKGIQTSSDSHYLQFYEYNTMDEKGNVVSPETNVLTFTASDSQSYETILKADETSRFALSSVYPDWTPDEDCRQVEMTSVTLDGTTLSWTVAASAKAFLIECGGEFVDIVDGTSNSYDITGKPEGTYTVRAANLMGGFGKALEQGGSTAITTVEEKDTAGNDVIATDYYTPAGMKQLMPGKGITIVVKTHADGSQQRRTVTGR